MPVHTGDEDVKTILLNLAKGSPTAVALLLVFYFGAGHMERMETRHAASVEKMSGSLNDRNLIAEKAVNEITHLGKEVVRLGDSVTRLTMIVDKLADRVLTPLPAGRP